MESTKAFNKLSFNLKNNIYEKYKITFEEIIRDIKPIILDLYGQKHKDIIEKKLKQIHFVNFFEKYDLNLFFYNSFDSFNLTLLKSKDNNSDLENIQDELNSKFNTLFDSNSPSKPKIYDQDVIAYNNLASDYSSNLDNEYSPSYIRQKLSDEMSIKKDLEYNLNTSMYSCLKNEISKLNLILDSDFLYDNIKNRLFLYNSSLICNVNNNFEKTDIILINPIKFNKEDVYTLIYNIISSINTDLIINENQVFMFDRGLNDCFIKHNFNHGIESDNRNRRMLIDFVNQSLTFEIITYLEENSISILGYTEFPTLVKQPNNTSVFLQFYSTFKSLILDSIITKNSSNLFNEIGEENFINFIDTSFEFIEESKAAYFKGSNYTIDTNPLLYELYTTRNNLLESMKNFKLNK